MCFLPQFEIANVTTASKNNEQQKLLEHLPKTGFDHAVIYRM